MRRAVATFTRNLLALKTQPPEEMPLGWEKQTVNVYPELRHTVLLRATAWKAL
jgi:hypothetical protein